MSKLSGFVMPHLYNMHCRLIRRSEKSRIMDSTASQYSAPPDLGGLPTVGRLILTRAWLSHLGYIFFLVVFSDFLCLFFYVRLFLRRCHLDLRKLLYCAMSGKLFDNLILGSSQCRLNTRSSSTQQKRRYNYWPTLNDPVCSANTEPVRFSRVALPLSKRTSGCAFQLRSRVGD